MILLNSVDLIHRSGKLGQEIKRGDFGNMKTFEVLQKLKPRLWVAGHMHCYYTATYPHGDSGLVTRFIALDKCLPGRSFLQVRCRS